MWFKPFVYLARTFVDLVANSKRQFSQIHISAGKNNSDFFAEKPSLLEKKSLNHTYKKYQNR